MEITNSGVLSFGNGENASFDTAAYIKKREKTVTGSTVSVSDAAAYPAVGLTVNITPVQEGSGDPSPENVRPIIGHTGVILTRVGKNLFDKNSTPINGYINPSGIITGTAEDRTVICKVTPNTQYTISFTRTVIRGPDNYQIADCETYPQIGDAVTVLARETMNDFNQITVTTSDNGYYMLIKIALTTRTNFKNTVATLQIEHGSTATAYEPYTPENHIATFPQAQSPVYGGTLDVTGGVLTVTHGNIASYNGESLTGEWISDRDVYAEGTTPTIGAQVVYELETPVTYQLTPTQIEILLGDNNIWADSGSVSLTYRVGEEWYSADPTISRSVSPILSMSRTADIENDFEFGDISEYDDEFELKELDEAELKELDEAETEQKNRT